MKRAIWTISMAAVVTCLVMDPAQAQAEPVVLEVAATETAVLDPANWNDAFPGALYFDALRPLLLRFPGVAEKIRAKLADGQEVESVKLVLDWERTEGPRPERGRHGWGAENAYEQNPGKWHVVVWPLRKPWSTATEGLAPTFNAAIGDSVFWHAGGARQHGRDIGPGRYGPAPLHVDAPRAEIDLTTLLTDQMYGDSLPQRLRNLDDNGLLLRKDELFDMKYRGGFSYDWLRSTGYMRIWVKKPFLRIVFKNGRAEDLKLPPAADLQALAEENGSLGGDKPSIYIPENLKALAAPYLAKPEWAEDWQWERLQQLYDVGLIDTVRKFPSHMRGTGGIALAIFRYGLLAGDAEIYQELIETFLTIPPRFFIGHPTSGFAVVPVVWGDLLPPGVLDHFRLYWEAFVHPEVENPRELRGGDPARNYFRGYCRSLSTMNFNFNSISGTMLAGQFLDAPLVLADARWGLEHILLRSYVNYDGAYQELGETYYLAISIGGAAVINNWAEDPVDRLMGKIARDKLMEPLITAYHPGLRRIVHPQCRGAVPNQLLFQDGPYHALHTLSPAGAILHLDEAAEKLRNDKGGKAELHGIPILGTEAPPDRMAMFAPYGESRLAEMVDQKELPWEARARHWAREPQSSTPGWQVNYLATNYGLSSREDGSVAPVVAHWRREDKRVENMEELSTLMLSSGYNDVFMENTGFWGKLQHENKIVALRVLREPHGGWMKESEQIKALHASIGIFTFGDTTEREVWINDSKMAALSGNGEDATDGWQKRMRTGDLAVTAKDGDIITVHDGATYIGIIPVSANAGARTQAVQLSFQKPLLLLHSYMYKSDTSMDRDAFFGADSKATAGFVIEIADNTEFSSFADFRKHMSQASLDLTWESDENLLDVRYQSGDDVLALGFEPQIHRYVTPHGMGPKPRYRAINDQWPPLPEGIHRDTPWSVQGVGGRVEKNGAVLRAEPGRTIYLRIEPRQHVFTAYNTLPDPTLWSFSVPGGMQIDADGRVGLMRMEVNTAANTVNVEHGFRSSDEAARATALLVFGAATPPDATVNGSGVKSPLVSVTVDGANAWVIPLGEPAAATGVGERFEMVQNRWSDDVSEKARRGLVRHWQILGPFEPSDDKDGLAISNGPGTEIDANATFEGKNGAELRWQSTAVDDAPSTGAEAVDLLQFWPEEHDAVGFASTMIESTQARAAVLYFGIVDFGRVYTGWTEEVFEVYLNGELIFKGNAHETPGRDGWQVETRLRQGDNRLLIKFRRSRARGWNFACRIADEYGVPLDGVAYQAQ